MVTAVAVGGSSSALAAGFCVNFTTEVGSELAVRRGGYGAAAEGSGPANALELPVVAEVTGGVPAPGLRGLAALFAKMSPEECGATPGSSGLPGRDSAETVTS